MTKKKGFVANFCADKYKILSSTIEFMKIIGN